MGAGLSLCLAVCFSIFFGQAERGRAEDVSYSVEGMLTYKVADYPTSDVYFSVSVSNCLWSVTHSSAAAVGIRSAEMCYDGTNTIQYFTTDASGPDVGSGIVEGGALPHLEASGYGVYVWLVYASGCYFSNRTPGSALSLRLLRSRHGLKRRYLQRAEWRCSGNAPFLPIELTYIATNLGSALNDDGTMVSLPLSGELGPEYAQGVLHSSAFVSFGRLSIPREFEYFAFDPRRSKTGKITLVTNAVVHGVATNIVPFRGFPDLPPVLHLEDFRVPEPIVMYKVTNASIPAVQSASVTNARNRAQRNLEARLRAEQVRSHGLGFKRWVAIVLVLIVVAAPVAYVALRRTLRRH